MKIVAIIFLFGLVTFANANSCPPREQVGPCECEEVDEGLSVSCVDETAGIDELKNAMRSLVGKKNVEIQLDDLNLGTLPSDLFSGIDVKLLDFSHCHIDGFTEDDSQPPFSGLEDSLEELVIVSSFTEENVPAKLKLGHLRQLKEFDLSYNVITELSNEWFSQEMPSLEYVTISNNGIENLGDRAFANLVNLKQLSLDGNRFGNIQRTFLPTPADNLEVLELDNNALTSVPEDIFSNMAQLNEVSLRMNGIATLEEKAWGRVWHQLDVIHLEGNPIECDSHMTWLFSLRSTTAIYGQCEAPRHVKGKHLQDFIDENGH